MATPLLQTLKGFRDFLPVEKRKRDYVRSKIVETFEHFCFEPLETPTLEYASLLLGKYGVEADKLVYQFEDNGGRKCALRYDQTVPTARVLAQYQHELPRYFRRYQIQNVFRAEKPQKGRFREFTQCDVDIFGSTSPIADAEVLACVYATFQHIGFKDVILKVNDRRSLIDTLASYATARVDVFSIIQSIDKLDKMSSGHIIDELVSKGLTRDSAMHAMDGINRAKPSTQLLEIMHIAEQLGIPGTSLQFCPMLARGLDYYTGMIFEISVPSYKAGSLGGGGRYDNLIKQLSGIDIPAVGVGLGFDRIVQATDELGIFSGIAAIPRILVTIFALEQLDYTLSIAGWLRGNSINVELAPHIGDIGKQLRLAHQKGIPFVLIAGEDEQRSGTVTLKDMTAGTQETMTKEQVRARMLLGQA
jgi:histidyl-tRNA synthetase